MIESIHIKNFRGIQDGKIDRFSKINLLVGPNNSGKSAVLEAIYLSNTASRKSVVSSFGINYDATAPEQDLLGYDPMEIVCERHMKKIETAQSSATISRQSAGKHSKGFSIQLGLGGIISKVALFSIETGSGFAREANEKKDEKFFFSLGKSFFAADFADRYKMPIIHLQPEAQRLLIESRWPGNVRSKLMCSAYGQTPSSGGAEYL